MVKLDCTAAQLIEDLACAATALEEIRRAYKLDAAHNALVETATDRLWNLAHSLSEPSLTPEAPDQFYLH